MTIDLKIINTTKAIPFDVIRRPVLKDFIPSDERRALALRQLTGKIVCYVYEYYASNRIGVRFRFISQRFLRHFRCAVGPIPELRDFIRALPCFHSHLNANSGLYVVPSQLEHQLVTPSYQDMPYEVPDAIENIYWGEVRGPSFSPLSIERYGKIVTLTLHEIFPLQSDFPPAD